MLGTVFFIILLEGFVTISVEMVAIRQLIPFFGSSIVITSLIIGVFLLFLAFGYWQGGRCQQRYLEKLQINFSLALFLMGFGLSYCFMSIFFSLGMRQHIADLLLLSAYLLVILAPITYLLGQTVPLTTNLFNQNKRVADISGYALFISTLGSFFGAVLTTLILFNYIGVAASLVVNCLLLLFLIILINCQTTMNLWRMVLLGVIILIIYILNIAYEAHAFVKTNNYANYRVIDAHTMMPQSGKIFSVNNSPSSYLSTHNKGFEYVEFIKHILFEEMALRDKDILVLGAGGFTLSAENDYDNHFTYVDIDKQIKNIAEKHFLNAPINGEFHGQDSRVFFNKNRRHYDVIISDAYQATMCIPPSLLTREYFDQIYGALNRHGIFVANIIAHPLFNDQFSRTVDNTIKSVFPYCMVIPLHVNEQQSNIIYLCPKEKAEAKIYTDDLNSVTIDYYASVARQYSQHKNSKNR